MDSKPIPGHEVGEFITVNAYLHSEDDPKGQCMLCSQKQTALDMSVRGNIEKLLYFIRSAYK